MTDQITNIQQLKKAFDRLQDKLWRINREIRRIDKAIKQLESEEEQAVADATDTRNG